MEPRESKSEAANDNPQRDGDHDVADGQQGLLTPEQKTLFQKLERQIKKTSSHLLRLAGPLGLAMSRLNQSPPLEILVTQTCNC